MENKFGKPFVQQARSNLSGTVNPKVRVQRLLMYSVYSSSPLSLSLSLSRSLTHRVKQVIHRLGAEAPKKSLVENYMVEIARNYHIEYQPDPTMFMVSLHTQSTRGVYLQWSSAVLKMAVFTPCRMMRTLFPRTWVMVSSLLMSPRRTSCPVRPCLPTSHLPPPTSLPSISRDLSIVEFLHHTTDLLPMPTPISLPPATHTFPT